MLRKIIMFAITSGLAARAWNAWRQRETGSRTRRAADRDAINTWETEGGTPRV
jgi:hypothetical protein